MEQGCRACTRRRRHGTGGTAAARRPFQPLRSDRNVNQSVKKYAPPSCRRIGRRRRASFGAPIENISLLILSYIRRLFFNSLSYNAKCPLRRSAWIVGLRLNRPFRSLLDIPRFYFSPKLWKYWRPFPQQISLHFLQKENEWVRSFDFFEIAKKCEDCDARIRNADCRRVLFVRGMP